MVDYIDTTLRVAKYKLGDLIADLLTHVPYAKFVNLSVPGGIPHTPKESYEPKAKQEVKKLPPPARPLKPSDLSTMQIKVIRAMDSGANTKEAIKKAVPGLKTAGVTRVLNNLVYRRWVLKVGNTYTRIGKGAV